jgi:hypothetical protein
MAQLAFTLDETKNYDYFIVLGPYSQHFTFIVTYKSVSYARVLKYIEQERLVWTNTLAYWAHS